MRQDIWLLIYSLPNLVWPLEKKKWAFDQNRVMQSLFVDKELYNTYSPLPLHPICEWLKTVLRNIAIINQPTAQSSVFHWTKFGVNFTLYSLLANTLQQRVRTWVHCAEEEIEYEMSVMWNSIKNETTQTKLHSSIVPIFVRTSVWHSLALIITEKTSHIMNVPDDSKAINFLCLPPVIPQTFKNFRHVISSKLTRYRSQAIRAPVNTLI